MWRRSFGKSVGLAKRRHRQHDTSVSRLKRKRERRKAMGLIVVEMDD